MDYELFFAKYLDELRQEGRYRVFADLERHSGQCPTATRHSEEAQSTVTIWCSNDYLGMS